MTTEIFLVAATLAIVWAEFWSRAMNLRTLALLFIICASLGLWCLIASIGYRLGAVLL